MSDAVPAQQCVWLAMDHHQPWKSALGAALADVQPLWFRPGEDAMLYLRGVRLRLGSLTVAIATGEVRAGRLSYIPDEVLVLFDSAMTEQLRE